MRSIVIFLIVANTLLFAQSANEELTVEEAQLNEQIEQLSHTIPSEKEEELLKLEEDDSTHDQVVGSEDKVEQEGGRGIKEREKKKLLDQIEQIQSYQIIRSTQELEEILKLLTQSFSDASKMELPELFGGIDKEIETDTDTKRNRTMAPLKRSQKPLPMVPELFEEWTEIMVNFNPDDMLSFQLQPGQSEVLYQDISQPTTIRGAFFIPFIPETNKIDFQIRRLDNIVVYDKSGIREHIFSIEIKEAGEYKFVFTSRRSSSEAYHVNFALDVHNSSTEHLQKSNIDPLSLRVERIHNAMRVIKFMNITQTKQDNYYESKFSLIRQEEGMATVVNTHSKLMLYTFLETMLIIAINLWQLFYVKRILQNTRLI